MTEKLNLEINRYLGYLSNERGDLGTSCVNIKKGRLVTNRCQFPGDLRV